MIKLLKRWLGKPETPQPKPVWARNVTVSDEDEVMLLVSSAVMSIGQPVMTTFDATAPFPCNVRIEVYPPREKITTYQAVITVID